MKIFDKIIDKAMGKMIDNMEKKFMKDCPKCNHSMLKSVVICPKCGESVPLNAAEQKKIDDYYKSRKTGS